MGVSMKSFELLWNSLPLVSRKRLLATAGYSKMYASRCFQYLPSWVRTDLEYTHRLYGLNKSAA